MKKILVVIALFLAIAAQIHASVILVPMDAKQKEHLKAYGITFWMLQKGIEAHWLLNYRGGSFAPIPTTHNSYFTRISLLDDVF